MTVLYGKALLFDNDGTLVDSRASGGRQWRKLAAAMGRPFSDLEPYMYGIPGGQAVQMMDPTITDEQAQYWDQVLLDGEINDVADVVALPGALAALAAVPPDRWALITSAATDLALARVRAAGIEWPQCAVTADHVRRGKPDPEPFRKGAELLGFSPSECIAFEDSEAGVASAQAAGCQVVALRTTWPNPPEPCVDTLADIHISTEGDRIRVQLI